MYRVFVFFLLLSLLLTSGCNNNSETGIDETPSDSSAVDNTVDENIYSPEDCIDKSNDCEDQDDIMTADPQDHMNTFNPDSEMLGDDKSLPKDGSVWVKYFNSFIPVSLVADGEQQLLNKEPEWYFDIQKRLGVDYEPNNAVTIDIRKMYTDSAQNPYDSPLLEESWISSSLKTLGDEIAISGDWEPFVKKVRYECYSLQSQPDNQDWINYFNTKIEEASAFTPLIIKNAWFFDIDGDGREESIVNASNTVFASGLEMSPPVSKNTATYTLTAYFDGAGTAIDMGGRISMSVSSDPVNPQNDIYASYTFDENRSEYTEQFIAAYQYDLNSDVAICPIFNCGEFDRWPEMSIVLADIDGDGIAELLTFFAVIYAPITVYHFDENLQPQVQFSINTPS